MRLKADMLRLGTDLMRLGTSLMRSGTGLIRLGTGLRRVSIIMKTYLEGLGSGFICRQCILMRSRWLI